MSAADDGPLSGIDCPCPLTVALSTRARPRQPKTDHPQEHAIMAVPRFVPDVQADRSHGMPFRLLPSRTLVTRLSYTAR
jgi:hypothetical protein